MKKELALSLGKLILATAWADGCLQEEEIEILNDLIVNLPEITEKDKAMLRIYMEYPISEDECDQILKEFKATLKNAEDKAFVLKVLKEVVEADGEVTHGEQEFYLRIKEDIESGNSGIKRLGRSLKHFVVRKQPGHNLKREKEVDQFIENPIYYSITHSIHEHLEELQKKLDLHKLSATVALMSAVAHSGQHTHRAQQAIINASLIKTWQLDKEVASHIANIALKHRILEKDCLPFCQYLYQHTSEDERLRLFSTLINLIKADGRVKAEEINMLHTIGNHLEINSKFIQDSTPSIQ